MLRSGHCESAQLSFLFCGESLDLCINGHRKLLSLAVCALDSKSSEGTLCAVKFGEIQMML
jgi:hypothetical protein